MVHLFVQGPASRAAVQLRQGDDLYAAIAESYEIQTSSFFLTTLGGLPWDEGMAQDGDVVVLQLKVCGGIDFQHREGSKVALIFYLFPVFSSYVLFRLAQVDYCPSHKRQWKGKSVFAS